MEHTHPDDIERQTIADAMGAPWRYVPRSNDGRVYAHIPQIVDDAGRSIHLSAETRGKWSVSGLFPSMPGNTGYGPHLYGVRPEDHGYNSINVSRSKTPEQIARDIKSRFTPGYYAAFRECERQRDLTLSTIAARDEALTRIAAAVGVPYESAKDRPGKCETRTLRLYFSDDNRTVEVSTFDGKRIDIKIQELSADAIIALLAVTHPKQVAKCNQVGVKGEDGTVHYA